MSIVAIIIGKGNSRGFPGKNFTKINGHPMMSYPIVAACGSKNIDKVYFSTEDGRLKAIAGNYYGVIIIDRPKELATDEALGEDVFVHAYKYIRDQNISNGRRVDDGGTGGQLWEYDNIEFIVLMFANAPCITGWMLDEMIEELRKYKGADSICTISKYNMFSPIRMRKFDCFLEQIPDRIVPYSRELIENTNCDRDSGADAWIYDCSAAVVRPHCLEKIGEGIPPQRWLGNHIIGYKQTDPALDVDFYFQKFQVEWWLDRNWI